GSERTSRLLGRLSSSSAWAVPDCVMNRAMAWYSRSEPSHQTTRSGWHIAAASVTQAWSWRFVIMMALGSGLKWGWGRPGPGVHSGWALQRARDLRTAARDRSTVTLAA